MYLIIKHLHMTFALLSILGFMFRGILAIRQHPIMQQKWIRIVPHINDTLLLLAAITLALMLQLNPLSHGWLMAKIVALLLYIALGTLVIKTKGSKTQQWSCYILAILMFGYIGGVAISKSPLLSGLFG